MIQTQDQQSGAGSSFGVRRRILLASRSGQLGGMELRLADEARFLTQAGHQSVLALSRFPDRDPWLNQLMIDNPAFSRLEFDPPPFFEEWSWRRRNLALARIFWPPRLRRTRIDLAHIAYAWTHDGGSRVWLCHKAGISSVLSIHNAFPTECLTPWHARLTRGSFASVRGLYGVSESALQHFLSTYGGFLRDDAVVRVIPNFVDISRFVPSLSVRQETRFALDIPQDAKVIGSVGRIDVQKQPFHILEVFDRLWVGRQNIFLIFCGQGPLESQLRTEVARKPWANQVRFLGFRQDVERVFPALDVHLLLSKQEGFGISTVEAMACGVSVVATDVPGSRDILTGLDAGFLVPFGDRQAAATKVAMLLDSPNQSVLAATVGRQTAVTQYAKEIWEQRLGQFYQETMHSW